MVSTTTDNETFKSLLKIVQTDGDKKLKSFRNSLEWIETRFQLELGDKWEPAFEKYCLESVPLFRDKNIENLDETGFKDDVVWSYFLNAPEKDINEYWQANNKAYIELLAVYRNDGAKDKNQSKQLMNFSKAINNDPLRYIYEIIQNADDCDYGKKNPEITIDLSVNGKIVVSYNEKGMTYADILALTTVGQSNKKNRLKRRLVGEKGIGFKTIFSVCQGVEIHSGGYHFALNSDDFIPQLVEVDNSHEGTTLILELRKSNVEGTDNIENTTEIYKTLKKKFGVEENFNKQNAFKNCPVLFTNVLKAITVKNSSENFTIKRDDNYTISYELNGTLLSDIQCVKVERNVEFIYKEYNSRYSNQFENEEEYIQFNELNRIKHSPVHYPIMLVAPLDTVEIKEGNLYSYLPTYTNIKAPFNIHLPLKLNLDRSCMWFIGDHDTNESENSLNITNKLSTNAWNNRLLKEMYSLIDLFYSKIKKDNSFNIFDYVPKYETNNHQLFKSEEAYADNIKKLNEYCKNNNLDNFFKEYSYFKKFKDDEFCSIDKAIMFDEFVHNNFYKEFYEQIKQIDTAKGKYLVEYNKAAFEKMRWSGFKAFEDTEMDANKSEYLNNTLKEYEIEVLKECLKEESDRSKYLPMSMKKLKILPVVNSAGQQRYEPYEGNFWFEQSRDLTSNGKICFIIGEYEKIGLFKELNFMKSTDQGTIFDEMIKNCKTNSNWDKGLFEEFMEIIGTDGKGVFEYTEELLLGALNKKEKNERLEQLIEIIRFNTREGNWLNANDTNT